MTIAEAQREMRHALLGGFMGQLVSGVLWIASAALATWSNHSLAVGVLLVGGFFIFPMTLAGLKVIGHRSQVSKDNPLNSLGMQTAFILPLSLPVVGAAALYRFEWFYPAFMIVLGAHYLPFVTTYGMRMFYVLAGLLVVGGLALALWVPLPFFAGAWFAAIALLVFAVLGRFLVIREAGLASS